MTRLPYVISVENKKITFDKSWCFDKKIKNFRRLDKNLEEIAEHSGDLNDMKETAGSLITF